MRLHEPKEEVRSTYVQGLQNIRSHQDWPHFAAFLGKLIAKEEYLLASHGDPTTLYRAQGAKRALLKVLDVIKEINEEMKKL